MLAALLIVGTVLAIPMLYLSIQWAQLAREEQSQVRELVKKAAGLPSNPSRFTQEQAARAEKILDSAYRLPSVLPSDIPQLSALWKARREIRRQARREQHPESHSQESTARATVLSDWIADLRKQIDDVSRLPRKEEYLKSVAAALAVMSGSVRQTDLESQRTPEVKIEQALYSAPPSKREESEKSQMERQLALVG